MNELKKLELLTIKADFKRIFKFVITIWLLFVTPLILFRQLSIKNGYETANFDMILYACTFSCVMVICIYLILSLISYFIVSTTSYYDFSGVIIDKCIDEQNNHLLIVEGAEKKNIAVHELFYDNVSLGREVLVTFSCRGGNECVSRVKLC